MDKKGFTLVELVTAIAVIGIMLSIAIPSYSSWLPRYRLKTSVRHIYDDMNLAKIQAIKTNTVAAIIFSIANNTYTVFLDSDGDGVLDGGETVIKNDVAMENGVNIYGSTFTSDTFGFNNRGMSFSSSSGEVHLTSASGLYMGVRVNTIGYISIIESSDGGGTWS